MTANYAQEFETVEIVINSTARTCGVDAFALSLIKAERQIRKLVTHLIYQFPCFGPGDILSLRQTLVNNRHVYFDGFVDGFNVLYPRSIPEPWPGALSRNLGTMASAGTLFENQRYPTWGNASRFRSQQSRLMTTSFVSTCSDSRRLTAAYSCGRTIEGLSGSRCRTRHSDTKI